jgi:hypothetical protein
MTTGTPAADAAVFNDIERIRAHSPELFATDPSTVPVRRNVVVWE